MLIRQEQIDALRVAFDENLIRGICTHLHRHFDEECGGWPDGELDRAVRGAVADARRAGVNGPRALYKYAALAVLLGAPLDQPWMLAILEDADILNPDDRVERLHAAALIRLRRAEEGAKAREAFDAR